MPVFTPTDTEIVFSVGMLGVGFLARGVVDYLRAVRQDIKERRKKAQEDAEVAEIRKTWAETQGIPYREKVTYLGTKTKDYEGRHRQERKDLSLFMLTLTPEWRSLAGQIPVTEVFRRSEDKPSFIRNNALRAL